ncbi:MAG: hypothetical protein KAI08_01510 [Bacteroidales bacterium]|nr:hypothetical protein [Bacteroidales bacterium]
MKQLVFFIVVLLLVSCEKDSMELDALGSNVSIIGTWIEDGQKGDTLLLQRSGAFDKEKYGFTINDDGSFIERKNSGWCGTPPIAYDNFEGSWEAVSDSLLNITVAFWGGMLTYQIRIVYLDAEELAIRYLYTEARLDSR